MSEAVKRQAMSAAIYCRISRDPSGAELGVRRQEQDCRAIAEREGWNVIEILVDDDRSAYSGKPRPAYQRLCELLKEEAVGVLVAWHPDRLTRQPRELEDLIDLLESTNTKVRTVQTGEYDLGTPSGRMAARIVGAVARHESEHKSARLRRKHEELAEQGRLSGGGTRPFGYDDDRLTVRTSEAKIIRDLTRRTLAGESLRSMAADLQT
ncbi:MAG: recombinase family protein, partial [Acidimicrobiia bacterium]|nr:recombinase family protein [Acidimicrobiia bacterium]